MGYLLLPIRREYHWKMHNSAEIGPEQHMHARDYALYYLFGWYNDVQRPKKNSVYP